ncbi:MAG: flagellar hook-associated protein FlgK [Erythrobacter sp.]
MSSVLINIGQSGALAARNALELTAQNIANASNPDYARRTLSQSEVVSTATVALFTSTAFSGVRVDGVRRTDSVLLQNQARTTASDLARANGEIAGLRAAEEAIEQTGLFESVVEFEAALARLQGDPLDPSLRAAALESARVVADTFQLADGSLETVQTQVQTAAQNGADLVNQHSQDLARINAEIIRALPNSSGQAALFDQRDAALADLSSHYGISVQLESNGVANVRLGDASGPELVTGTSAETLNLTTAADGTISFDLGGTAVSPSSGSLAGLASALVAQSDLQTELDALALSTIGIVNTAQANGTAPDGSAGQPLFSGTGAGDISIALTSGAGIATAPAGSPAQSRDVSNLSALRDALQNGGPADQADALLFGLSSRISGQEITQSALQTIATSAQTALQSETGVDLDTEAANLVRFQQAFQASSRIMQVANDIFDSILAIR